MDSATLPTVSIAVKSVYSGGQARDFRVARASTVRELKRLVAREFPGQPAPQAQKFIFGGKICADGDVLDALLAQQGHAAGQDQDEQPPVVFHLLVAKAATATATATATVTTEEPAAAPQAEVEAVDSPRPSTEATPAPSVFAQPPTAPPSAAANSAPAFMSFPAAQAAAQPHHDVYRQMALMQQQAVILTQIQYLQQLQQQAQAAPAAAAAPAHGAHAFGAPFYQPYMPFGNFYGPHMGGHFAHHMPANAAQGVGAHAIPNLAAAAAPVVAPAAPRGPPPVLVAMAREVLPLFEIRLALKMAFMLFLIGQDTPTDRILMLGLLSFISYLHITGIFAKIYEVYQRHRRPDAAGNDNNQAEGAQAAPGAAAQPAGAARGISSAASLVSRLLRISSDRGMVQDVKYFCVGLLLSLVPAWHPQPLGGGEAPPLAPAENAMPEGAEIPLQGI